MIRDKRERNIEDIKTTKPGQWVCVRLRYELGGMNYFSGQRTARGYYLSVTPETWEKHDGYTSRSFMMFSGLKGLVLAAPRYSAATLARLSVPQDLKERLIEAVRVKEGITFEGTRGIEVTIPAEGARMVQA